jgi:carbonic anhydrase
MKFIFALLISPMILSAAMTPEKALQTLMEGNQRFSADKSLHPDRTSERRQETAAKQEPFAIIVGCSDSRVAPEIIFDQGIGDLFIVRVAGNVAGPVETDSIEYSALYLHSSVILVMGHENCGAIKAVLAGTTKDIESVAELIQPAAKATANLQGDRLEATIKANVKNVVAQLKASAPISQLIKQKKIAVVGGYYDFHTGKVMLLQDSH